MLGIHVVLGFFNIDKQTKGITIHKIVIIGKPVFHGVWNNGIRSFLL